jgi:hypothetical protein
MIDFVQGTGDYYESIEEFLEEDQTLEFDVVIRGMNKRLRIRALSFAQMERISKHSTDDSGIVDNTKFVLHTLVEGVVRPKFNEAKARRLLDANGETIKELAESIWQLGRVSKKQFEEYVNTIQELNKLPKPE